MEDTYDFIFFDDGLRDRFVEFTAELGIPSQLREDPMGLIVALPDSLDDDLLDRIEAHYEELEQAQSEKMSGSTTDGLQQLAGIRFELPDGRPCLVPLQVDVANRLLAQFTIEEIQQLFRTVIESSAADDSNRPVCQILRSAVHEEKH